MKLSETLKDWPKDNYYSHGSLSELPMDEVRSAFSEGYSTALTSCDYEIYRDELAKEIHKKEYRSIKWHESPLGVQNAYLARADHIISTMPTWLKPTERK